MADIEELALENQRLLAQNQELQNTLQKAIGRLGAATFNAQEMQERCQMLENELLKANEMIVALQPKHEETKIEEVVPPHPVKIAGNGGPGHGAKKS